MSIQWGVKAQAIRGETESGDQYVVETFSGGALVGVIDGLGHGPKAAAASKAAVAALEGRPQEPVTHLMEHCHRAIRGTRGAVVSLASFNFEAAQMTWLGVGNVRGLLLRADPNAEKARDWLLVRGGVVGYQIPTLRPITLSLAPGDALVFTTDGIRSGFADELDAANRPPEAIAEQIFTDHRRGTDDTLVLVAKYVG